MFHRLPFVLLQVALLSTCSLCIELNCPLEWVTQRFDDPLPPTAVATASSTPSRFYISRVWHKPTDGFKIGTVDQLTGLAYIHDEVFTKYQILTNPNDCDLRWVSGSKKLGTAAPIHAWPTGHYGNVTRRSEYVGRVQIADSFLAGNVRPDTSKLLLGDRTAVKLLGKASNFSTFSKSFQILTSSSGGLSEMLSDFDFELQDLAPSAGIDYIGGDIIRNDGDAELIYRIFHRKTIKNTYMYNHRSTLHLGFYQTIGVKADVFGMINAKIDLNLTQDLWFRYQYLYENHKEQEIIIQRDVIVPPRQAVQVCSIIEFSKSLSNAFPVTSQVSGKGMSGKEVFQLLKTYQPDFQGRIESDSVVRQVSTRVSAVAAVTTKFIVLPLDAMEDCQALRSRAETDTIDRENEIKAIREKNYKEWLDSVEEGDFGDGVVTYEPELREEVKFSGERADVDLLRNLRNRNANGIDFQTYSL